MARRTEAKWQTPYFLTLSCGRQTAPESTCVGSFGQCSFVVAGLGTEAEKELGKVGTKPGKNSFSTKVSQREQLDIQDSSGRLLVAPPSAERSEAVASGFSPTCTSYQHITCAECLAIRYGRSCSSVLILSQVAHHCKILAGTKDLCQMEAENALAASHLCNTGDCCNCNRRDKNSKTCVAPMPGTRSVVPLTS